MNVTQKHFEDRHHLSCALADHIGKLLRRAVVEKGRASMAVSGGSTPGPLFRRLSELDIPWEQVVITLVDERWVDVEDKDSNEYLVRTHLLQDRAAKATFIGMKQLQASRSVNNGCGSCPVPLILLFSVWVMTAIPPLCFPVLRNLQRQRLWIQEKYVWLLPRLLHPMIA